MVQAGHVPKPTEQRRNRNPKQAGDWILLPKEGFKGKVPSCAGHGLSKAAQKWWKWAWRTSMASQWTPDDVPALLELAVLRDELLRGETKLASEVRIRSDQFGLTPAGRQARRWMITEGDVERARYRKPGTVTKLHVAVDD